MILQNLRAALGTGKEEAAHLQGSFLSDELGLTLLMCHRHQDPTG